jgi:hypothetical protein
MGLTTACGMFLPPPFFVLIVATAAEAKIVRERWHSTGELAAYSFAVAYAMIRIARIYRLATGRRETETRHLTSTRTAVAIRLA